MASEQVKLSMQDTNNTIHAAFICNADDDGSGDEELCSPETALLVVRDSVLLESRGVVLDTVTGTVYDLSGGCCLSDVKRYKVGDRLTLPPSQQSRYASRPHRPLFFAAHSHDTSYYHFVMETLSRLVRPSMAQHLLRTNQTDLYINGESGFHFKFLSGVLCGNNTKMKFSSKSDEASTCYAPQRVPTVVKREQFPFVVLPPAPTASSHLHILSQDLTNSSIRSEMAKTLGAVANTLKGAVGPPCHVDDGEASNLVRQNQTQRRPHVVVLMRGKNRMVRNLGGWVNSARLKWPGVDFRVVPDADLSSMSLHDMGAVFCSAVGLVGGHGAGLTNMMWLAPDASFVAQITRPHQAWLYKTMASVLKVHYVEASATGIGAGGNSLYANVVADLANLTAQLTPWLTNISAASKVGGG